VKGLAIGKTARPVEFDLSDKMADGPGNPSVAAKKVKDGVKAANRRKRNKGRS